MLGLRALGIVLVLLATALLSVAATITLAQLLGTTPALVCVAVGALLGAALALWRAGVWRERIGFARTRAALETSLHGEEGAP